MDFYNKIRRMLANALEIPAADLDDSRRRRLLNIILFGVALVSLLTAITAILMILTSGSAIEQNTVFLFVSALAAFIGSAGIYSINRYLSGRFASILFLLFLMTLLAFADTIPALVNGRSLFLFLIPIIMAGVLLGPISSFIFYGLVFAEILILARIGGVAPNIPALISFMMLTLLTWLSSKGLEDALHEVRRTDANLDGLVAERTEALAKSLARERAEAGQRQAILNSIADGVIVFDTREHAILANPAIQNLIDRDVNAIVDRTFDELLQSSNLSSRDKGLLQTMMATNAQSSHFRIEWGARTLSIQAAQVFDTENEEIGTVAVFRDVTREAELERLKSSFIAIVSHELRTPLNAIIGFAEMLKEAVYGPVNDRQAAASERILVNSGHMLSMVGDLLDQAKIEAGKLRIIEELFSPADLLRHVREVMEQALAEKGLRLTIEVDAQLPGMLMGDVQRLQQIVVNLVNNAIKFTDSGGVHIRLCVADTGHWEILVQDTGRGIPQEELGHIFEAFHQVDAKTTRQQGGFGLGLSIVNQLVNLMKGEIHVHSILGSGTTFTVKLPLDAQDIHMKQTTSNIALIIEDEADLATIFAEALRSSGFETEVIRDGSVAERRLLEISPYIVILDMHLPHVDGSTLFNQIRANGAMKDTIVIIATADALMAEIYREAADIVLVKPISFTQMRDLSSRLRARQWNSV